MMGDTTLTAVLDEQQQHVKFKEFKVSIGVPTRYVQYHRSCLPGCCQAVELAVDVAKTAIPNMDSTYPKLTFRIRIRQVKSSQVVGLRTYARLTLAAENVKSSQVVGLRTRVASMLIPGILT